MHFAGHVVGSLVAFNAMIRQASDSEIEHFIRQTATLDERNFWVFEYALKDVLLKLAREERAWRGGRSDA